MRLRRAGLLAHPTSLPGPYGIGDLGTTSLRFLDWAAEAGQSVWQVLPLGPPGAGGSPYSGLSVFAGNPLLISPEALERAGWLEPGDLRDTPPFAESSLDFQRLVPWKLELLRRSWKQFLRRADKAARRELEAFVEHTDQASWLEDWALFSALRRRLGDAAWATWDPELRLRRPAALRAAARELRDDVAYERYLQFVFDRQWRGLHRQARQRGIDVLGDLPFYVAYDSADVWAHPELFLLDPGGMPLKVSGVPPDYFSDTGQLWGNPIYRWDRMAEDGYAWWVERLRANLRMADAVRLDHFRAFAAHWEVDPDEKTAARGRWAPGPGRAVFDAFRRAAGDRPLVAEDLGVITDDVHALRRELGLPCMRVVQFAFGEGASEHAIEHHTEDTVVYTGTHDNDTLRGWFSTLEGDVRQEVLEYFETDPRNVVWRVIEAVYGSVAALAVLPLQDVFGLGSEARMNRPGRPEGNWRWRAGRSQFRLHLAARLRSLVERSGRLPGPDAGNSRPGSGRLI